jgi:hypothetical protein
VLVLPSGRVVAQECPQGVLLLPGARLLPIRPDRLPEGVVESLVVGVAVLDDEGRDPLQVRDGQAVADSRSPGRRSRISSARAWW